MLWKQKNMTLKTSYYTMFLILIVIPIFIVLFVALSVMNVQFRRQAIENIERAQENIVTDLETDISMMSMRLSHLIYTNDNEILKNAAKTNNEDITARYQFEQQLAKVVNIALEPVKEVVSVGFYMKQGQDVYVKMNIHRSGEEIRSQLWYQEALKNPNTVELGAYQNQQINDLYSGGMQDMLILIFALAPDVSTDRSQTVEMVTLFQSTDAAERIKKYNETFLKQGNKLGLTRIFDTFGVTVFDVNPPYWETANNQMDRYTVVKTPVHIGGTTWYIESLIETRELTTEFWKQAIWVLASAGVILILGAIYFGVFMKRIIQPIEAINSGLYQIREGNLDVYIKPGGQQELQMVTTQFNAMVRQQRTLIGDYEKRVRSLEKRPEEYLSLLVKKKMTAQEIHSRTNDFFVGPYKVICFFLDLSKVHQDQNKMHDQIVQGFLSNPRFASHCILAKDTMNIFYGFYQLNHQENSESSLQFLISEIQQHIRKDYGVDVAVCISELATQAEQFNACFEQVAKGIEFRRLEGSQAIIDWSKRETVMNEILERVTSYDELAQALYIADEKNILHLREELLSTFQFEKLRENQKDIWAMIISIGRYFERDNASLVDIFGKEYSYSEKIMRIQDVRSLKLWVTNFLSWIMDYSASRLHVTENNPIIRAKRYIVEHYENPNLNLLDIANEVGLNEKYFTHRFSKEAGETITAYITSLRIEKAKELLKSTTFKVYEIAEMVGYQNAEHFSRVFKKHVGISPMQYRKQ